MIRRYKDLPITARFILLEMMSYDIPNKETGRRKGYVFVSQQTIAENLGIGRESVNRYFQKLKDSPFIGKTHYDMKKRVMFSEISWDAIYKATIDFIDEENDKVNRGEEPPIPPWNSPGVTPEHTPKCAERTHRSAIESQETIEGKLYNLNSKKLEERNKRVGGLSPQQVLNLKNRVKKNSLQLSISGRSNVSK